MKISNNIDRALHSFAGQYKADYERKDFKWSHNGAMRYGSEFRLTLNENSWKVKLYYKRLSGEFEKPSVVGASMSTNHCQIKLIGENKNIPPFRITKKFRFRRLFMKDKSTFTVKCKNAQFLQQLRETPTLNHMYNQSYASSHFDPDISTEHLSDSEVTVYINFVVVDHHAKTLKLVLDFALSFIRQN